MDYCGSICYIYQELKFLIDIDPFWSNPKQIAYFGHSKTCMRKISRENTKGQTTRIDREKKTYNIKEITEKQYNNTLNPISFCDK